MKDSNIFSRSFSFVLHVDEQLQGPIYVVSLGYHSFYPCDDLKIYHTLPHSEFNVEYFIDFSLV